MRAPTPAGRDLTRPFTLSRRLVANQRVEPIQIENRELRCATIEFHQSIRPPFIQNIDDAPWRRSKEIGQLALVQPRIDPEPAGRLRHPDA